MKQDLLEVAANRLAYEVFVIDSDATCRGTLAKRLDEVGFRVMEASSWPEVQSLLDPRIMWGVPLPEVAMIAARIEPAVLGSEPALEGAEIVRELITYCERKGKEPIRCIGYTPEGEGDELSIMQRGGAMDVIYPHERDIVGLLERRVILTIMERQTPSLPAWFRNKEAIGSLVREAIDQSGGDAEMAADKLHMPVGALLRCARA
jgi:hypothetical protein